MNLKRLSSSPRRFNKRGISAVVATVLIILITIAAVAILWAAIIPMINGKLNKGTACMDASSQLSLENNGYTCYNPNNLSIQIKHGSQTFGLSDVQVLIYSEGNTESIRLVKDAGISEESLPKANEEKTFLLNPTTSLGSISKVAIAPIISVGNQQDVCGTTAPVVIKAC